MGRLPPWPPHDASEEEAELRVIRSGRWGRGKREEVDRLAAELSGFIGVDHVRAVTNDTLELGLACLGIQPGDEVLVPAFTFIFTGSSILSRGAVSSMFIWFIRAYLSEARELLDEIFLRARPLRAADENSTSWPSILSWYLLIHAKGWHVNP